MAPRSNKKPNDKKTVRSARGAARSGHWSRLSDEDLLDLRFCDLDLQIEGTWLEEMVDKLHSRLDRQKLRCRPHCWISNEWFSPDGVPGIAIPFYLAHPRLMKLERRQMLEVEGGTRAWCMRILRHEAGHAVESAFRLRRRRDWQRVFGRESEPYPDTYKPEPYSRAYVLHLDWWYAQSHPVEDFAETFAVWLDNGSRWKRTYKGWPALTKLKYVDGLMREIAGRRPPVRSRKEVAPHSKLRRTLRAHYKAKRKRYGVDLPHAYERELERLFPKDGGRGTAAAFLRRAGRELRELVAESTGQHPYTIDQILREMITSCRALGLRVARPEAESKVRAAVLLTAQVMDWLHSDGKKVAL